MRNPIRRRISLVAAMMHWYSCTGMCACVPPSLSVYISEYVCVVMRRTIQLALIFWISKMLCAVCIFCAAPELNEIEWCLNVHEFEWNKWMEQTLMYVCRGSLYNRFNGTHRIYGHTDTTNARFRCAICYANEKSKQLETECTAYVSFGLVRIRWTDLAPSHVAISFTPRHTVAFYSIHNRMWLTSVRVRCSYRTDRFSFFLCFSPFLLKQILNQTIEIPKLKQNRKNTQNSEKKYIYIKKKNLFKCKKKFYSHIELVSYKFNCKTFLTFVLIELLLTFICLNTNYHMNLINNWTLRTQNTRIYYSL